jgi:hypothetical protein
MRKSEHRPPKTRTMQLIEMDKAKRAGIPYHIEFDPGQPRTRTMELIEMNRARMMGVRFSVQPDPQQSRTPTMEVIERDRVRRMQPDSDNPFVERIRHQSGDYTSRSSKGEGGGIVPTAIVIATVAAAFILVNISIFVSVVLVAAVIFFAVREHAAAKQVAEFEAFGQSDEIEVVSLELDRLCQEANQINEQGHEWGLQSKADDERNPLAAKLNVRLDLIESAASAAWRKLDQLKQHALSQRSEWESKVREWIPACSGRNAFAAGFGAYCLTAVYLYLVHPEGLLAFSAWIAPFIVYQFSSALVIAATFPAAVCSIFVTGSVWWITRDTLKPRRTDLDAAIERIDEIIEYWAADKSDCRALDRFDPS